MTGTSMWESWFWLPDDRCLCSRRTRWCACRQDHHCLEGPREARRAVTDALPFLAAARQVIVAGRVVENHEGLAREGCAEVVRFLMRHGVKAEETLLPLGKAPPAEAIADHRSRAWFGPRGIGRLWAQPASRMGVWRGDPLAHPRRLPEQAVFKLGDPRPHDQGPRISVGRSDVRNAHSIHVNGDLRREGFISLARRPHTAARTRRSRCGRPVCLGSSSSMTSSTSSRSRSACPHLDFGTIGRRRFFCEEELRLNSRLAPDTYLDLVPLRRDRSVGFRLGGARGRVIDWLVKMRRLPQEDMLDRRVETGQLSRDDIAPITVQADRLLRLSYA